MAPGTTSTARAPVTRKMGRRQNSSIWSFLAVFMGKSTQFFWLWRRFQRIVTLGTRKLGCRPNSSIWSFLADFVGYSTRFFWLRRLFQRLVTPCTRKLGRRQNSSVWSFLAFSMGYSTQFLASEMISTARYPGYTKNWTSSKLVDLVIPGRFRGL